MNKKILFSLLTFFAIASLILAACAPAATPTEAPPVETEEEMAETEAPMEEEEGEAFRVGFVTDTGGIDDKSFNTTQWNGVQRAVDDLGVEAQFIQSDEATQYEPNLTEFASQGYDLIIAAGFFLGGDLAKVAANYPDSKFTIVDYAYPDPFGVPEGVVGNAECIPNVQGQVFKTDQPAFLAGYLAAGMTQTGKIGFFGGAKIPTVTYFGVGYQKGMEYYNEVHGTNVELVGWDNDTGEGLFTGDFADLTKGKEATESLFDEGVDIFIPVGGLIGAPGFDVARERGGYGIWVDVDGYNLLPESRDVILTSVMKNMDNSVYDVIDATMNGNFDGCGVYVGDLVNDGVGLASYHDLEDAIPDDLKAEVEDLRQQIISGEIEDTGCISYPEHCPPGLYEIVATTEPEAEEEMAELGSADHPIKVLFVPSVDVDYMIESGALIEQGFKDATGLEFEVSVPTSYAATIEEMCASPDDTIGFIPAVGYALANQLCGVEPGLAAERFGRNVYWAQFIVQRDSDIQTLEDLEGKTWGYGDVASTSGYLYPKALLGEMGITWGDEVETGGHSESAKAVYNGEVDFATTYFSPPEIEGGRWELGDPPDIPDDLIEECALDEDEHLMCGGYQVLDARSSIATEAPDIVQQVRILDLTPEIPNDTLSFGPEFPEELKAEIMDAVIAFLQTDACQDSLCNERFYNWTAASPIFDENFDGIRILMAAQGITLENIGE